MNFAPVHEPNGTGREIGAKSDGETGMEHIRNGAKVAVAAGFAGFELEMTDFSTETDEVFGGEMDVADVRWTSFSAARQETDWHKLKSTLGKGA